MNPVPVGAKALLWHFVTWLVAGAGATLGYLVMAWLWGKL